MSNRKDGGYYAIKGFLYQFDKSLIEIIKNPTQKVEIEKVQDVNYSNYVLQIKHKEAQKFSPSKVRKPIKILLDLYKEDKSQKYRLYCHFKDKEPQEEVLSLEKLDEILGNEYSEYTDILKKQFVENFILQFSEDYENQFMVLIALIQSKFGLKNKEHAIIYHSIFRSNLLDIAVKGRDERNVDFQELQKFIGRSEKTIFYLAYEKYLSNEKYIKLIRKEYFTFKKVNIDNFERLFIIVGEDSFELVDINKIVSRISKKYYRKDKSPQPFICFHDITDDVINQLKIELVDQGIHFRDGTCFDGDRFRLDQIISNDISDDSIQIKIIDAMHLNQLMKRININEIYQFYFNEPMSLNAEGKHIKIQISEINQIVEMFE